MSGTFIKYQSEIPAAPWYVTMNDSFMSGWGGARGKIASYVYPCASFEEAEAVAANARARTDQRRVNIVSGHDKAGFQRRPRLQRGHIYQVVTRADAPRWYEPGAFARQRAGGKGRKRKATGGLRPLRQRGGVARCDWCGVPLRGRQIYKDPDGTVKCVVHHYADDEDEDRLQLLAEAEIGMPRGVKRHNAGGKGRKTFIAGRPRRAAPKPPPASAPPPAQHCNCENLACAHRPGQCAEPAHRARAEMLGPVCDACSRKMHDYLLVQADGRVGPAQVQNWRAERAMREARRGGKARRPKPDLADAVRKLIK